MDPVSTLFAPFKNHDLCLWFYLLSVAGFVLFLFSLFGAIFYGLVAKNKSPIATVSFYGMLMYLIVYFQNRLLYSMCVKSI